ncbi:vWA domain-containing protein [Enterococcus sp. AZ007]|uniref:vWA domain-containing protein n=1 Tax=Enterococcus sp. AZ007 TaxID=2774839 RepID=UPI003F266930
MKKLNLFMFFLMLLSLVASLTPLVTTVHADTIKNELIDEKFLKLSYSSETKKDSNEWRLNFKRISEAANTEQRLKVKLTDDKDQVVTYPNVKNMDEKGDWLIEKGFSTSGEDQVTIELSKSMKKLKLYVQVDQKKDDEVEESILERKEPFTLVLEDSAEKQTNMNTSSTTELHKAATEQTLESKEFVGPRQTKASAQQTRANLMYRPIYTDKQPQYKQDGSGEYPIYAWQPEGQTNVKNHQGGIEGTPITSWDGKQSWDVTKENYTNSYIKYGEESNPNLWMRKYAQQTDKKDEFKVKLNVRGNTIFKPGVDVVFLLDNTGSMTDYGRKKASVAAVERIVSELKKVADPSSNAIRVGAHVFASYDKSLEEAVYGWKRENTHFKLSNNPNDWDKIASSYDKVQPLGPTFTQRGLQEAADIFNDPASDIGEERHKLLFMLTDGAPNSSWQPLTAEYNSSMYFDRTLVTSFDSGVAPNYSKGLSLGATGIYTKFNWSPQTVDGQKISSHLTTTNSTAYKLKSEGIEIHSIALQISSPNDGKEHSIYELLEGMYKTATKKANATGDAQKDYFFYHSKDTSELTQTFKDWYQTIIRTADKGKIVDPLGDMVELVGEPKVKQVSNGALLFEEVDRPTITPTNNNRQIEVGNINLTGGQEIEVEYTVRLKPTAVSNRWYPVNKTTTLAPTPERTTDLLEFGSPSVRVQLEDFVIPVEKVWAGDDNDYWGLRPNSVNAVLQKWDGSAWKDVETKTLNPGNNWKAEFSAVQGGADHKYRVLETLRKKGYKQARVNQESFTSEDIVAGGIKITNEMLKGEYKFFKFLEDRATPFTNDPPKFTVRQKGTNKILAQDLEPNSAGQVTVSDLPIGDFIVEETYVPLGFKKMPFFEIKVTENNPPTSLVAKVNDSTEAYKATNILNDFSLQVEKKDAANNALSGATFTLKGPSYEKTEVTGPTFNFSGLKAGSYELVETKAPDEYSIIQEPIRFTIKQDGKVEISPHPNVSGSGGINGGANTINLKVTNNKAKAGILPSTGGGTSKVLLLVATGLVVTGTCLGSFYLIRSRREG